MTELAAVTDPDGTCPACRSGAAVRQISCTPRVEAWACDAQFVHRVNRYRNGCAAEEGIDQRMRTHGSSAHVMQHMPRRDDDARADLETGASRLPIGGYDPSQTADSFS